MCCFIRELDLLLDEWLFHGAWAPLAIAVALLVSARALRVWRTLRTTCPKRPVGRTAWRASRAATSKTSSSSPSTSRSPST